ncbi:radical SAM/SPASM domain-containing protein [Candidatus Viridilinea mediisalina]|uniref:Radical SAM core domain-containing protein n=1 Tax=Candidatus Viridilinea mediisalina TaxID=2024553 RepID=A0A2A6RH15_9CHLR|nr:radical SAM protein [Candidatus Viridilinea mediisalina]PDW02312.1 hypothetical protein CJ255_14595 [Candidatus Viridilinea mediisalina]
MAHVIVASDELLCTTPNDCGCAEYRRPPDQPWRPLVNDCGFWDAQEARRQPVVAYDQLVAHPLLQMLPLTQDYKLAFVPSYGHVALLDAEAAALVARLPLGQGALHDAEAAALQQLAQAGLVGVTPTPHIPPPPAPTTLVAWLHLTSACNLRCGYCYVAQSNVAMTPATAHRAVDAVLAAALRHGYRSVLLKYGGGEPLLQLPLLLEVQRRAQAAAQAQGVQLAGAVLSNGVLLDAAAATQLAEAGLSLMVSLDGPPALHDAQRPTAGGKPSFDAALRGLHVARRAGVAVNVGITVTAANIAALPEFVALLLAEELPFSLSLYREAQGGTGLAAEAEAIIAGMRRVYAVIAAQPPRWSLLGALLDRTHAGVAYQRSCAAGEHYMVIDPQGQVARCQMSLDEPLSSITAADPLGDIRRSQRGAYSIPVDSKEDCRGCGWRYWCGGGCPVATYRATGCHNAPSPHCAIYQALLPELLCLEGQRILYWQGYTNYS